MKKGFTVFDAFTVLAVYLLFENRVSWWFVPLPWFVELVIYVITVLFTYYGTSKRLEFSLWKFLLKRKMKKEVHQKYQNTKEALKHRF